MVRNGSKWCRHSALSLLLSLTGMCPPPPVCVWPLCRCLGETFKLLPGSNFTFDSPFNCSSTGLVNERRTDERSIDRLRCITHRRTPLVPLAACILSLDDMLVDMFCLSRPSPHQPASGGNQLHRGAWRASHQKRRNWSIEH